MSAWKKFSEQKPPKFGAYLIFDEIFNPREVRTYRNMLIGWWTPDKRWFTGTAGSTVTHWCELPNVPEDFGGGKEWNLWDVLGGKR